MAESNTAEELIPKKGATSVVWNWFGYKRADKEQTTVICKQCKNTVISKGGNTSNLFHHLKQQHPVQYEECQKACEESSTADARKPKQSRLVQHGIAESLASCTPYDRKSKRWKDITQAVTICLAKDMMPIQTVEKEGFKQLVKKLDPRYTLPKRKYFSKTALPDMYEEYREKVEASLSSADYYASTTDLWSSRTTEPYLSLTVHYINSEWELCNSNLETSYFPEDHTGENIATGLREFLQSWDLNEEKQVCVTTDSGANVVKALRLNDWTRLSCFGHRLHIAIDQQYSWSPSQYFDEDSYPSPPRNMKGLSGGRPQLTITSGHTCGLTDCEHSLDHLQHGGVPDGRQAYLLSPTESCPADHHRCSPRSSIHSDCMAVPISMPTDHVSSSTFPRMHYSSHHDGTRDSRDDCSASHGSGSGGRTNRIPANLLDQFEKQLPIHRDGFHTLQYQRTPTAAAAAAAAAAASEQRHESPGRIRHLVHSVQKLFTKSHSLEGSSKMNGGTKGGCGGGDSRSDAGHHHHGHHHHHHHKHSKRSKSKDRSKPDARQHRSGIAGWWSSDDNLDSDSTYRAPSVRGRHHADHISHCYPEPVPGHFGDLSLKTSKSNNDVKCSACEGMAMAPEGKFMKRSSWSTLTVSQAKEAYRKSSLNLEKPAMPQDLKPSLRPCHYLQVPLDEWAGYPGGSKDDEIPCRRMRSSSYVKAMGDEESGESDSSPKNSPPKMVRSDALVKSVLQRQLSDQSQSYHLQATRDMHPSITLDPSNNYNSPKFRSRNQSYMRAVSTLSQASCVSQVSETEINGQFESVCESVFSEVESQAMEALDLPGCFRTRSHSYLRAIQAGYSQDDDCVPSMTSSTVTSTIRSTTEGNDLLGGTSLLNEDNFPDDEAEITSVAHGDVPGREDECRSQYSTRSTVYASSLPPPKAKAPATPRPVQTSIQEAADLAMALSQQWREDVKAMRRDLAELRKDLCGELRAFNTNFSSFTQRYNTWSPCWGQESQQPSTQVSVSTQVGSRGLVRQNTADAAVMCPSPVDPTVLNTPSPEPVDSTFLNLPTPESVFKTGRDLPSPEPSGPTVLDLPSPELVDPTDLDLPSPEPIDPTDLDLPSPDPMDPTFIWSSIESVDPNVPNSPTPEPLDLTFLNQPTPEPLDTTFLNLPSPEPVDPTDLELPSPEPMDPTYLDLPSPETVSPTDLELPSPEPMDPTYLDLPSLEPVDPSVLIWSTLESVDPNAPTLEPDDATFTFSNPPTPEPVDTAFLYLQTPEHMDPIFPNPATCETVNLTALIWSTLESVDPAILGLPSLELVDPTFLNPPTSEHMDRINPSTPEPMDPTVLNWSTPMEIMDPNISNPAILESMDPSLSNLPTPELVDPAVLKQPNPEPVDRAVPNLPILESMDLTVLHTRGPVDPTVLNLHTLESVGPSVIDLQSLESVDLIVQNLPTQEPADQNVLNSPTPEPVDLIVLCPPELDTDILSPPEPVLLDSTITCTAALSPLDSGATNVPEPIPLDLTSIYPLEPEVVYPSPIYPLESETLYSAILCSVEPEITDPATMYVTEPTTIDPAIMRKEEPATQDPAFMYPSGLEPLDPAIVHPYKLSLLELPDVTDALQVDVTEDGTPDAMATANSPVRSPSCGDFLWIRWQRKAQGRPPTTRSSSLELWHRKYSNNSEMSYMSLSL